jgi:hypothetical protein
MVSRRSIRFNRVSRAAIVGNPYPLAVRNLRPFVQPTDSRILVKLCESVEPVSLLCENRLNYGASHKASTKSLFVATIIGFFVLALIVTTLFLVVSADQMTVSPGGFASSAQPQILTQPAYLHTSVPGLTITTFFAIS